MAMGTLTSSPRPMRSLAAAGVIVAGVATCGWVLATNQLGPGHLVAVVFVAVLSAIGAWDARTMRAPNHLVFPAILVGLLMLALLGQREFVEGAAGGVAAFSVLLVLAVLGKGAMGYGDVKTAAVCGMAVGVGGVFAWLLASFLLGGLVALVVLATGFRGRRDYIALTPFLLAGVVVTTVVFGTYLVP